jgi:hypothetical protein
MACVRCNAGWICEAHPDQPFPHDECAGPGTQCQSPDCPWWRGPVPAPLNTDDWTVSVLGKTQRMKPPH